MRGSAAHSFSTPWKTLTRTSLTAWAPKLVNALSERPELRDVSSDQQDKGLRLNVSIDRSTASRLRHPAAGHRRYPLRRVRAADGIDHLYAVEPVPGHSSRQTRVHAGPDATGIHLSARCGRRSGAALRLHRGVRDNGPPPREPSGAVPVGHRLLQPANKARPSGRRCRRWKTRCTGCNCLPASAGASRGRPRSSGHLYPASPSSSSRRS